MQRALVHLANLALLVTVLIGIPAVASKRIGGLQISSNATTHELMIWGFGIGVGANLLAVWAIRGQTNKQRCWKWVGMFGVFLIAQWLLFHGYIHFRWLRDGWSWLTAWF